MICNGGNKIKDYYKIFLEKRVPWVNLKSGYFFYDSLMAVGNCSIMKFQITKNLIQQFLRYKIKFLTKTPKK